MPLLLNAKCVSAISAQICWCRNDHVTFTTRVHAPIMLRACLHHEHTFPTNIWDRNILTLLVTGIVTPGFIEHCTHLTTWFIFINSWWNSHFHTFICLWSRDFIQDISQEIDTNLPACRVLTEECKFVCEPVIDLMERQLCLGGLHNGLEKMASLHNFPTECRYKYQWYYYIINDNFVQFS